MAQNKTSVIKIIHHKSSVKGWRKTFLILFVLGWRKIMLTLNQNYNKIIYIFIYNMYIFCVQTGGKSRIACLRVERHTANCASASQFAIGRNVHTASFNTQKCSYRPLQRAKFSYRRTLDFPRLTTRSHTMWLFFTNLDTKRRVYFERHGGDVTRVNICTRHNRYHAALGT